MTIIITIIAIFLMAKVTGFFLKLCGKLLGALLCIGGHCLLGFFWLLVSVLP